MRRTAAGVLLMAICLSGSGPFAGEADHRGDLAAEPADGLDLSARVIDRQDLGKRERVRIDLKLRAPDLSGRTVRIRGTVHNVLGTAPIRERRIVLPDPPLRKVGFTFELVKGFEHHVEFTVDGLHDAGRISTAYVRVNLDPRLEPERLEDAVQYRAVMAGR